MLWRIMSAECWRPQPKKRSNAIAKQSGSIRITLKPGSNWAGRSTTKAITHHQSRPLAEVYNNLGVVAARRGQKRAAEDFERAIQNDPSDPDYHFNLAITLARAGDREGAARELRTTLEHRPNDVDAKTLLESLTAVSGSIVSASSTTNIE